MTKTQITKTIKENQYLRYALSTQISPITKEPYNARLKMARYCTTDLTENNKSKPWGLKSRDNNLQAIANKNNKKIER